MKKASQKVGTNKTNGGIGFSTQFMRDLRRVVGDADKTDHKRLPAEREMADLLAVSRATLRQGLAILEQEGLIWRHVGRGTFVGPKSPPLTNLFHELASVTSPNEVMEARLAIEPKIASIAALRATLAELADMNKVVEMASTVTDIPRYERLDGQFHKQIAEASRNSLLLTFFNAINAMREEDFWGQLKEKRLKPHRMANYNIQHRKLLQALKRRDAALAEELMTVHLRTVQSDLEQ